MFNYNRVYRPKGCSSWNKKPATASWRHGQIIILRRGMGLAADNDYFVSGTAKRLMPQMLLDFLYWLFPGWKRPQLQVNPMVL